MDAATTCYRHPAHETRIACQRCQRPICPSCMIPGSVGFQCPECVRQASQRTRQRELPYGGKRSANPALTSIILIVMSGAIYAAVSIVGGSFNTLFNWLALKPLGFCDLGNGRLMANTKAQCLSMAGTTWVDGVATGAWWQIITSAFTHADMMHIAFNMLALWFLGPQLEAIFGRARYLALYFASALTASALVMWLAEPWISTVGASGAIFGLMGAVLLVAHKHRGNVRVILMWLAANVVITVIGRGFISWQGHLGGFIGGVLVALAVMYVPKKMRPWLQWVAIAGIAVASLAAIVIRALQLA